MPAVIPTFPAALTYEIAFNASPNQSTLPPWYTDLSARTKNGPQATGRGRQYELDTNTAGTWRTTLENKDGALDPGNSASPYAPGVTPFRSCRIRAMPGANLLTADQATAGEATGYTGTIPGYLNIGNDYGYTPAIATTGTAYQGSRVYQVTLPAAATANTTVLLVTAVPVIPGTAYSFSAQVRIPSGTSTATSAAILWYAQTGASLTPVGGTAVTPASGSTTWLTAGVSGTAPTGAYSAALKVQIASGSTSAQTTWQVDGLQFEQSATVTGFQVPQSLPANLLPRAVATGSASINPLTDAAANYFYCPVGTIGQATGLSAAPTGATTALAWSTPPSTTNSSPLYAGVAATGASATGPVADCAQVTSGTAYTMSGYFMRTTSADTTIQLQSEINWFDSGGNRLTPTLGAATTISTGAWTRVTATGTAPAGAVWARLQTGIYTPTVTTATNLIYAASLQFEAAASASTWLDPGPTYQVFNGLVERWPQAWTMNGTYGVTQPVGVDALAALAQYTLRPPFVEETLALNPDFFYLLADPATATSCADSTGKRIPAPIENSPAGAGSLTLGSGVTANSAGSAFLGAPGPVATFANNPSQGNTQEQQTYIALHETTTTPGPPVYNGTGNIATNMPWTRMIAFRCSTTPAAGTYPTLWACSAPSYSADQSSCLLFLNPASGKLSFQESGAAGTGPLYTSTASVCDGNWHQAFVVYSGLSGVFSVYLDGALVFTDNNAGAGWAPPTSIVTDVIGANVVFGRNAYVSGWVGDAAHAAQFPAALTSSQISTLYASWRSASSGESTGARAARVLTWIGWAGPAAIDTGQSTSMGPATDLTGATALDALNAVALTENGNFFASSNGALTFASRTRRYNQTTPVFVFGESAALGEWPYESISLDYDPSHLFNIVQVAQSSTGQVATAQDAASQGSNYPRILQRTINPSAYAEAQDAANYLLRQYKSARERVADLTLHPSAIPGLFAVCLQLEIGTRVRVMRRPPGAPLTQLDVFVESIAWNIDPESGNAVVHLQCSPADLASYWVLGALRTTLRAQAASGQNQATINALPDAAINALSSSLPQGYQLVFDPGQPTQETMTLSPTGIPSTNPGYSTAVLTFTSNFQFTHNAGASVCEPLPTGYTDPTTWDASSALGAASCAVVSGGASGTNTITVGPLGDSTVNTLASDWATGDLLWISPGTVNFEGYNLLHPNVSTAGEGALPLAAGTSGAAWGLSSDLGTPTVTASGTAWQGANVWQVSVAGGAVPTKGLLYVLKVPITGGLAYTASAYTRSVTSGANPTVQIYIKFLDSTGASLAQANSTSTVLTGSATAPWTRMTVTATAPAAAVWAQVGLLLTATAPASAWSWQADGLQLEQASSASTYCTTPQVLSVAASVPGYSSVQITLNTNLINSHSAGDTVCDPLPPGTTSPAAVTAGARLAY